MKKTKEKYRCANCGKEDYLVKYRSYACYCEKCYNERLEKKKIIRELNKMVML